MVFPGVTGNFAKNKIFLEHLRCHRSIYLFLLSNRLCKILKRSQSTMSTDRHDRAAKIFIQQNLDLKIYV